MLFVRPAPSPLPSCRVTLPRQGTVSNAVPLPKLIVPGSKNVDRRILTTHLKKTNFTAKIVKIDEMPHSASQNCSYSQHTSSPKKIFRLQNLQNRLRPCC